MGVLKMSKSIVSIDFGQSQDYTALAVAEVTNPGREASIVVRHLHRFPLGTSYPNIISSVKKMLADSRLKGATAVIDASGVGRAVLDLMHLARVFPVAVTITGGTNETHEGDNWHVPKKNLVSAVSVMLDTQRLKVADGLEFAPVLRSELGTFKAIISTSGNTQFEAHRPRDHDDLVLAVALACWQAQKTVFHDLPMIVSKLDLI
jgi:hypothetical protein